MSAVSANLATAMDSTLNEASSFTKVSSNLTSSQATEKFSFITVGPTLAANNIKILTSASLLRLSISSPKANSNAFVLKAGFKYFQSASGGVTGKSIYTLQEGTGITMTGTSTAVISTGANAQAAADVLGTNLVLCATPAAVWIVDVVAASETLTAALLQTTAAVLTVDSIPTLGAYFIGKSTLEVNLLNPTTLQPIKRPTLPVGRTSLAYLSDNLDSNNLFVSLDDQTINRASWVSSISSLSLVTNFLSSTTTFGSPVSFANLGSFQVLMVFVYRSVAPTYILALDKSDFSAMDTSTMTIPGLTYVSGTATGMIQTDAYTFYWGQVYSAATVYNFHTYVIRVDACLLRNYLGICTKCIKPTILVGNTTTNLCNFNSAIPTGWGIDSTTGYAAKCKDPNCLMCSADYSVCTACDTAKAVRLVGNTCQSPVTMGVTLVPTQIYSSAPYSSCGVLAVWLRNETAISVPPGLSNYLLNTGDPSFNQPNLTLTLTNSAGQKQPFPRTRIKPLVQSSYLAVELDCSGVLADTYSLDVDSPDSGQSYTIEGITYSVVFEKKTIALGDVGYLPAKDPSGLVWVGTYGLSSIDQPTSTCVAFAILGLDPTGTFFRFTKILQIVNKLYFININYGKRLEAFLAKTRVAMENVWVSDNLVYNSANFRARLDQAKVGISLTSTSRTMTAFYLLSWGLQILKRFMLDRCTLGRVGIYFCHYSNKVHLIVFNLVFIDFIWLAPRTLLQSRGLSRFETNAAILVVCLLSLDLYMVLCHLLDPRVWRKALEHYAVLSEFRPDLDDSSGGRSVVVAGQRGQDASGTAGQGAGDETFNGLVHSRDTDEYFDFEKADWRVAMKQINYKKTYFEIDFNVHLMDMATWHLKLVPSVLESRSLTSSKKGQWETDHWTQHSLLCRVLVAYPWFRVLLFQGILQVTQYAVTTGLLLVLALEIARLFATIYAYLKYKYLKNIICLLMEVSQSIFLTLFFVIALLISPKRFDEPVIDFYQDAGIWIVIASCVAEYLLLITYITVAAYEFIKNRNMMKKMKVKPNTYSLFRFDDLRPWLEQNGSVVLDKGVHLHSKNPPSAVAMPNASKQGEADSIDQRVRPMQRRMQELQVNAVMPINATQAQKVKYNMNSELSRLSEANRGGLMPRSMVGKQPEQARQPAAVKPRQASPNPQSPKRQNSPPPQVPTGGAQASVSRSPPPRQPDPNLSRLMTNQNDTTQDPLRAQTTLTSVQQQSVSPGPPQLDQTLFSQQTGVSSSMQKSPPKQTYERTIPDPNVRRTLIEGEGSSPNMQNSRGYLVPVKPSSIPTLTNFTPGQGIMDYATMLRNPDQVMIPGFSAQLREPEKKLGQYELGSGVPIGQDESNSHNNGQANLPQVNATKPSDLPGRPVLPAEYTASNTANKTAPQLQAPGATNINNPPVQRVVNAASAQLMPDQRNNSPGQTAFKLPASRQRSPPPAGAQMPQGGVYRPQGNPGPLQQHQNGSTIRGDGRNGSPGPVPQQGQALYQPAANYPVRTSQPADPRARPAPNPNQGFDPRQTNYPANPSQGNYQIAQQNQPRGPSPSRQPGAMNPGLDPRRTQAANQPGPIGAPQNTAGYNQGQPMQRPDARTNQYVNQQPLPRQQSPPPRQGSPPPPQPQQIPANAQNLPAGYTRQGSPAPNMNHNPGMHPSQGAQPRQASPGMPNQGAAIRQASPPPGMVPARVQQQHPGLPRGAEGAPYPSSPPAQRPDQRSPPPQRPPQNSPPPVRANQGSPPPQRAMQGPHSPPPNEQTGVPGRSNQGSPPPQRIPQGSPPPQRPHPAQPLPPGPVQGVTYQARQRSPPPDMMRQGSPVPVATGPVPVQNRAGSPPPGQSPPPQRVPQGVPVPNRQPPAQFAPQQSASPPPVRAPVQQSPPPNRPVQSQPGGPPAQPQFVLPPNPRHRSPPPTTTNYTMHPIPEARAASRSPPPNK